MASVDVKTDLASNEKHSNKGSSIDGHDALDGVAQLNAMSDEEVKKLEKRFVRRVDLRMSIMILVYIMNYLDRNNAGAARLKGFQSDLGADDTQFATILSILYVGYILMQIPSNYLLNYMGRPSLYLPCAMLLWGMLSTLTGEVTSYGGAVAIRFFLGFVEAAFFPGALFLLSKWYTRRELALRSAVLYTGSIISNAINGLIAAGILGNMGGVLGHAAWRWLFYIEGAITMFIAAAAIFILPDFPKNSKFLSPVEKVLAQRRMARDSGGEADEDLDMTFGQVMVSLVTDIKVWLLTALLTCAVMGLSFNAYFPTLTGTLGYSSIVTLLLIAPPWVFAAMCCFFCAWHADRTQEKTFHIVIPFGVACIGLIIAMATQATGGRFFALFLLASGYAGFVVILSWISSTIARPPAKRAAAIAFINAFSQLANIAGSYIFPTKWGPTYRNSFGIELASFGLAIIFAFALRFYLMAQNRKLEAAENAAETSDATGVHGNAVAEAAKLEGISTGDAMAARRAWRYLL